MEFRSELNCWQIAEADRVSFLIDGEAYFNALADACEAARNCIFIIGWDVDSRIRLRRGEGTVGEKLGQFVDRLARTQPDLHIYILEWDFAMLYSLERESLPLFSLGWQTHERVRFMLDDEHPVGASHHQKIVVVDDRVAFVGGFDLAICRWDNSAHAPVHPERRDNEQAYGPFHDIQMMVDGEAAACLGELARRRWQQKSGDLIDHQSRSDHDPWPDRIEADLTRTQVAILRTEPEYDGRSEVREIEKFYLDAIARARSSIYIENQYFTSHKVGKALAEALARNDGPEVLMVLPRESSGWLEKETMGVLRKRLLHTLYQADTYDRLKVCYPDRDDLDSEMINVHSKLCIVDDDLLTVGSANLNNRSMGFDTECNLAISAEGDPAVTQAIKGLRTRLLAEHFGTDKETVANALAESGSLLRVLDSLADGGRSLQSLPVGQEDNFDEKLYASEIVDPEQPINMDRLLDYLGVGSGPRKGDGNLRARAWRFGIVFGLACLLAIAWRWSPLNEWLNLDNLLSVADYIRVSSMTIPIVLAIYLIGSCLMFPVTLMILATALSFGPFMGFGLAFGGSLLGGLASYLLGRWLGRDVIRKLAGEKLNRISRKLARRGWLTVALVRVLPIAPFTIVNLVAGASQISTRSFLIGTAIGMGPGILAIMIFEGGLEQAVRNPHWGTISLALLALLGAVLILYSGRHWLLRQDESHDR